MAFTTDILEQTAVYWPLDGVDQYGTPKPGTAVEIDCRWEDVAEEFIDPTGTRQVSRSKVFVGQDVDVSGLLMLGDLDDVADSGFPADPRDHADVWEIRSFAKAPNFSVDEWLRTVML